VQCLRCYVFIIVCVVSVSFSQKSAAENVCNETVPENRFVDGYPAYAQCQTSLNNSIWSNDGINTNTTTPGTGWAVTQFNGGYLCTEFAYRYLYFRWKVNHKGDMPKEWCEGTLPSTLKKKTTPTHGDIAVFAPGACSADIINGHVAVVDVVDTKRSTITIVEQDPAGRRSCPMSSATCFLHAVDNTVFPVAGSGGGGFSGVSGAAGRTGTAGKGGEGGNVLGTGGSTDGVPAGASGAAPTAGSAGIAGLASAGSKDSRSGGLCDVTHRSNKGSVALILTVVMFLLAVRGRSRFLRSSTL
jgi:surface antigen